MGNDHICTCNPGDCDCNCCVTEDFDEVLANITDLMEDIDEVLAEITEEKCGPSV